MGYSGYVYVSKDLILQLVACEIVILLILKRQEEVLSTTLLFLAEIFVSHFLLYAQISVSQYWTTKLHEQASVFNPV